MVTISSAKKGLPPDASWIRESSGRDMENAVLERSMRDRAPSVRGPTTTCSTSVPIAASSLDDAS